MKPRRFPGPRGLDLQHADHPDGRGADALQVLTERQREVLKLSARRRSAKQIAAELNISEGRVNQHIAAIKQRLAVNDLAGLHDAYETLGDPYRKTAGQKSQLPCNLTGRQEGDGASPDSVTLSDAMPLRLQAPWENDLYRVGPGAFDGPGGHASRIAAIVAISLGLPVLIVLGIVARWALTAASAPTP